MISFKTLVAAAVVSFGASAAFAQTTTTTAPKTPTATTAPAGTAKKAEKAKAPRSAESIACSAQADAKNLHGKERSKFRKACIKDAKTAAKKAS